MLKKRPKKIRRVSNEKGSVIIIALMVLCTMSVIGIMAADITITENFIIRNVAIYKQNVCMVESAIIEGLQKIIQSNEPDQMEEINAGSGSAGDVSLWLNSDEDWKSVSGTNPWSNNVKWSHDDSWYDSESGRVMVDGTSVNWIVPDCVQTGSVPFINIRGETADQPLRMALVGWTMMKGENAESLKETNKGLMRKGRLLAEYVSADYGMIRLDIGLKHKF